VGRASFITPQARTTLPPINNSNNHDLELPNKPAAAAAVKKPVVNSAYRATSLLREKPQLTNKALP
jgi:hypothetical protein